MTVLSLYQQHLSDGAKTDELQSRVVQILQKHYDELLAAKTRKPSLFGFFKKKPMVKGVYIWGDVGRGKTFLMDIFFNSLPISNKRRQHYQQFFKEIHTQLQHLPKLPNPLAIIAKNIASQTQILCIDEFHVDDITDAMIIHGLLEELFRRGVVLVMTSNMPISKLYANGLQRDRFLPAIKLMQENMESVSLDGRADYRMQLVKDADRFFVGPENVHADFFERQPLLATAKNLLRQKMIEINRRPLFAVAYSNDLLWTTFGELCVKARSSEDYLELCAKYKTIFLQGVPVMAEGQDDYAQRFIQLIDTLYDRRARLVVSAAAEPSSLYCGKNLAESFKRTVSRLEEMRSLGEVSNPTIKTC